MTFHLAVDKSLRTPNYVGMEEAEREGRVVATIPADTFAHRLLLVRAQLHLTVKEASDRCGLNYGSWSKWERGALPRDKVEIADAIAEGLSIDRDWLLFGGPLTKPTPTRRSRTRMTYSPIGRTGQSAPPGRRVRRPRRVDRRQKTVA